MSIRIATVCVLGFGVLVTAALPAAATDEALWLRYPAISPDGGTIAFSYRGDIWTVGSQGGEATRLTVHDAHDFMPVWSNDGRSIAFASDRYGNDDVFVMPAAGGTATRLTFHSANDRPTSFTPGDDAVLFWSGRLDAPDMVGYPRGEDQPELYSVRLTGGMPTQVLTTPAKYAVWDSAGERLAYSDEKGLEDEWRKHDDSSFARDVWLYDAASGDHTRLTAFAVDDRNPVWAPGDEALYYLSESSGDFNVWSLALTEGAEPRQVTEHDTHPVRFLSISDGGDLCYGWDGAIYVRPAGSSESRRLTVTATADARHNEAVFANVADSITEIALSPDGTHIAFIARGEVFVTSTEHGDTRRLTDTPEQERSVSFHPGGRGVLYASERHGSWNVYRTDLTNDDETSFSLATTWEEKPVLETGLETFQPHYSPDGKEVAYLEERTTLKVLNLATGESRTILPGDMNYSYVDGDQWYEWSPDGKWFLVSFLSPTRWSFEAGLVPASGAGKLVNLTESGYEDLGPRWALGGEAMYWFTDRQGAREQSGWPSELDVYAIFLTRKAWDRFHLSESEVELFDEQNEEDKDDEGSESDDDGEKEGKKGAKKSDQGDDDKAKDKKKAKSGEIELPDPVKLELDDLEERTRRLTLHSSQISDAVITPDGEKVVYAARFEKGVNLWLYEPRKDKVEMLAKLDADQFSELVLDTDGETAYVLADGAITSVEVAGGKTKPVKLSAKMMLDAAAEREYLFEHMWRQTSEKFLVEDMHGVDWDLYKTAYARFLPHIDNRRDLAEAVSEMQGELNASHMGCFVRDRDPQGDATASLGFFPDPGWDGKGVRIAAILDGGPLEKAEAGIVPGVVIEAINGDEIAPGANWYPLLNHRAGELVRLSLRDPEGTATRTVTVKPISLGEERELLYWRWVRSRRAEVDRLSGGRIGYAHVRTMSDSRYREIFEDIFGKATEKEAIILDTRFNNGGNLVEALTVLLTGETYARQVPRGRMVGMEPSHRWTKPSIVVMNEGNYSDAHCFPAAYTELGIGETVGTQVPGTCSAVWWETLQDKTLTFGIPQVGQMDNDGDLLENKHLDPDHWVDNDPEVEAAGRDQQLEKAVEVMLETLG
ncbi:MAG: S41 family peptidase [Thermoanaerobaculales bacterium]|nr:S41 family peptidase [Thermoanaerobaculales bacterium]